MEQNRVIKVFLASPMDLSEERNIFRNVLRKLSGSMGRNLHITYEVIGWEDDVVPDSGDDAQDVVNRQISLDYDIFVCLFRDRIGTRTHRSASGSVEEYERALLYKNANPELRIMCYFLAARQESDEIRQLKERMARDGILFNESPDQEAFENEVFKHFSQILLQFAKKAGALAADRRAGAGMRSVSVGLVTDSGRLLVVRRSLSSAVGAGLWQLPGGKLDAGEEPAGAAVREIREELGIRLEPRELRQLHTFHTTSSARQDVPLEMTLFLCPLREEPPICINRELEDFAWLELDRCDFSGYDFLGINLRMVEVLWRERYFTSPMAAVLDLWRASAGKKLPAAVPSLSPDQLNMVYATLSVLGLVRFGERPAFASEYAEKVLRELVCIAREGASVFEDAGGDTMRRLQLPATDYAVLQRHRDRMLFSHRSLMAILSCKATVDNSRRTVCDVLIFGECRGKKYLLLRWDFFSDKFQLISAGVSEKMEPVEMAGAVVQRRFSEFAGRYFDYMPVARLQTSHFSAGSVDNDPILRHYTVEAVAAAVKQGYAADFLQLLHTLNSTTELSVTYGWDITREQARELKFYKWCDLDALLRDRTSYAGHEVRSVNELVSGIGPSSLLKYPAIPITEDMVEDGLEDIIQSYRDKAAR